MSELKLIQTDRDELARVYEDLRNDIKYAMPAPELLELTVEALLQSGKHGDKMLAALVNSAMNEVIEFNKKHPVEGK